VTAGQLEPAGQPRNGGVIADVDGTLLDAKYLHVAAWREAFGERGHDIRRADARRALGMASAELAGQVLGRLDPPVIEAHSRHAADARLSAVRSPAHQRRAARDWPAGGKKGR
jgi:beta-phosphoglucomutase-like phosphatase (HAD superfamily)